MRGDCPVLRRHPDIRDCAPVDTGRGQSHRPPVMSERVEAGVGGNVIGLTGVADESGDRRKQDEEFQVHMPGQLVQ